MIESIIRQEINKIAIPTPVNIIVSPKDTSTFVEIDISQPRVSVIDDLDYSYLDLYFNIEEKRLEHLNYRIQGEFQGKGYGRKIIEAIENAGKKLGFDSVRINVSTNDSFWEHIGYFKKGEYLEKKIR